MSNWQPPMIADPYSLVSPTAPNRGKEGVKAAWDAYLWWHALDVNYCVDDLINMQIGPVLQ
jgi:hypothetical protein